MRCARCLGPVPHPVQNQLPLPAIGDANHEIVKQRPGGTRHRPVGIEVVYNLGFAFLDGKVQTLSQIHLKGAFASLDGNLPGVDFDFDTLG